MNNNDRTEIEELKTEVKGLAVNFEELSKASVKGDEDLYACYNEVAESLHEIKTNHLAHLDAKIDKAIFRSSVSIGGLAFIAVMIALLGCMIAFWAG